LLAMPFESGDESHSVFIDWGVVPRLGAGARV